MNNTAAAFAPATAAASLTVKQADSLAEQFGGWIDAAPRTIGSYKTALRQLIIWLAEHDITQPARGDIMAWRDELKATRKPATVALYVTAVRLFFRWLSENGIYPNIADHLKGAKLDRTPKKDYLTAGQIGDLLHAVDRTTAQGRRDYAILLLMATCGLRCIEVQRANIGDIRNSGGMTCLYIQGKGHEEAGEAMILPEQAEKAIRDYLATRDNPDSAAPLFASDSKRNRGDRMTTRSLSRIAQTYLRKAALKNERTSAHSLRHSAVTLALMNGCSLQEVQQFARHSSINTTLIYAHNLDAMQTRRHCGNAVAGAVFG